MLLKMSTTIEQWRLAVGSFGGGTFSSIKRIVQGLTTSRNSSNWVAVIAMILVYSNITSILLLRAGIETNPGPIHQSQSG